MTPFEKFQRLLMTILISVGFFYGGYYFGKRGFLFEVRKNPPKIEVINRYPADEEIDFKLFWDVWDMVSDNYLERPVDPEEMLYGAISGMVSALGDPYTSFLTPEINKAMGEALNGTYQGIGAELGMKEGSLMVVAPLDGSPAKAAGVRAGDRIVEIEGESTAGITINEAVAKIRGASGTVSHLTLQTGTDKPRPVDITRGVITISSVTWEDKGDGVAYIRVSRFGDDTNTEWSKSVREIDETMEELDSVIVDVRGNPGGYLQSAVYLAEEFVEKGVILYQETATGDQIPLSDKRRGELEDLPMVLVLIDGGSASASEILAAALDKHVDATLVGTKSFGKGTIQDAKEFADGSGIHITIAKWLTPDKVWVHKEGITPDVEVEITDEDLENEKDAQLEKAIELAKEI
jgi:carboxyl-terminal processing protease